MNDGTTRQPIPIGESDFKMLREHQQRYVDRCLFIRDMLDTSSKVLLPPQLRRFGKTLSRPLLSGERSCGDNRPTPRCSMIS